MKKVLFLSALFCAALLAAAPLDLQMPFKKGEKDAVEGWKSTGKLINVAGGKAVALDKLQGIEFKKQFTGKAGDKLAFEINMKKEDGFVSLRAGQWSKEGWIGENFVLLEAKKEYSVVKGEIILKDATAPDKAGIMRKVNRFHLKLYAHSNSKGTEIKDIKIELIPAK